MKSVLFFEGENSHPVHQAFAKSVEAVNAKSIFPKEIRMFDIAFVEGMQAMHQAVAAKEHHPNLKIIYHDADCFFSRTYPKANAFWKKLRYAGLLDAIDGVISDSYLSASYVQSVLDVSVKVVYPFVDVKRYSKVQADLRSKTVLFCGRFGNFKNSENQVWSVRGTPYKCLAVGNGSYLKRAMKHAPSGTSFIPWVTKPEQYFKRASILLNVSEYEPFGCVALEAICAGLIPLLGPENGNSEVLGSSMVLQDTDWQSIREKIQEVMNWSLSEKQKAQMVMRKKAQQLSPERQIKQFKKEFWRLA